MKSFVGVTKQASGGSSAGRGVAFVKQQFRKGFEIPLLPHQKYGILSKILWPSKNQIIRIVPGFDPETGAVYRQNVNCGEYSLDAAFPEYLSDTFVMASVVSRFGALTTPFLTGYEPGSEDERAYGGETVLHNFIRGILYACNGKSKRQRIKPHPEWTQWANIGPGNRLSYDKPALLMQALVFQVNGQDNTDYETQQVMRDADGDVLPLLAVVAIDNKTSIANLGQALVEPLDPAKPLDALTNSKYGGMAELDGRKLFLNTYIDTDGHTALRPSVQGPGQGWTPSPFPLDEEQAKSLWHPWGDLLSFMTAEEQLRLCAEEFGKDTVNYVIGTDPKFSQLPIPEDIRSAGLGRYEALAGGSVQLQSSMPKPAASGLPKQGGVFGSGLKGATAAAPAFPAAGLGKASAPKPAAAVYGYGTLDVNKIKANLDRMRQSTGKQQQEPMTPFDQADAAADLLEPEN